MAVFVSVGVFIARPSEVEALAVPPDSCFNFDAGTGTITYYYTNQNNDTANPACPRAIDIPATIGGIAVTTIGSWSFGNDKVTDVTFPSSITTIASYAFWNNNELTSLTIPPTVMSIGDYAFSDNKNMKSVAIEGNPTTIGTGVMEGSSVTSISYNGMTYTTNDPIANADACFSFDASTGTITGMHSGDLQFIKSSGLACLNPTLNIPSQIGGVVITAIGFSSFQDKNLTSATIPTSVTSIGDYAFYLNNLTSISIPNSVTNIGNSAFDGNQLTAFTIPISVTNLGVNILRANPISSITYNGVTHTASEPNDDTCFSFDAGSHTITNFHAVNLQSVVNGGSACLSPILNVPASIGGVAVKIIGSWSLGDIYTGGFTSVTLPEGLQSIGQGAFAFNRLTKVTIPASVQSIDSNAFSGQNPLGGTIDWGSTYLWNDDPAIVQNTYDSIWYAQLSTADQANSHNLVDGIMSERWYSGSDYNNNSTTRDSLGGAIVNPAHVTVKYVDSHGNQLLAPQEITGIKTSDGSALNDYSTKASAISAPLDPYNPTAQETTDTQAGFAQYYRAGQHKTFTPTTINDYITPSAQTKTLVAGENTITFVYQSRSAPTFEIPSTINTASPVLFKVEGSCSEAIEDQAAATIPKALQATTVLASAQFTVNCATPNTQAAVSVTLDRPYDTSLLKVFKQAGATISDITNQVSFADATVDGKIVSVIQYNLKDGGFGDEDSAANGKIVDPIFITLAEKAGAAPSAPNTGLKSFNLGALLIMGGGLVVVALLAITTIKTISRMHAQSSKTP